VEDREVVAEDVTVVDCELLWLVVAVVDALDVALLETLEVAVLDTDVVALLD
jgi:hypothetical protein